MQVDDMTALSVRLTSPVSTSFRCQRAADSLDIDVEKKAVHTLTIPGVHFGLYDIGLILGASGSGKTTLAQSVWGEHVFEQVLDPARPVIDQFPDHWEYDDCAQALTGIGLTAVPCWIRPAYTLSNGQRARAEAALQIARLDVARENSPTVPPPIVLDEWTSVVDRTVAKVMSHCLQKYARRAKRRVVVLSCHYDVTEWLSPDWIIDCNAETFQDRRGLHGGERSERLEFFVAATDKRTWPMFSRYHYLSDKLPKGGLHLYGLWHGPNQIGFVCYANYVPPIPGKPVTFHANRLVVHPDYAGLGLGIRLLNATAADMVGKGFRVMGKYSSTPVARAMMKAPLWKLRQIGRQIGKTKVGGNLQRGRAGMRENVKTYSFDYIGGKNPPQI